MGNKKTRKYNEDNPDVQAIRKYEREIEALQEKYDQANDSQDWSMRNFYSAQLMAKRGNLEALRNKIGNRNRQVYY